MARSPRRVLARILPGGLRWRLAAWVALVTLVCTGIGFAAVYKGTGSQLRHQIDAEMKGDEAELAHTLVQARARGARQLARAASSYIASQPFSASSTLLFVLLPGQPVSTNRPELFGRNLTPDNHETLAEQGEENRRAARLLTAGAGYSTVALPDVGDVRLLKRTLSVAGGLHVRIGVGEPLAAVGHAQSGVAKAFILAGLLALAGALFAAYLVAARVSRPLRRMAAVATRVDAGDLFPRIHDVGGHDDELRVLAEAFNHMLDRLTDAFASQSAFVADASHELRTPLTVIRGQLELLASQPDPGREEVRRVERLAQAELARISRLVDDLLLLAKSEQPQFLQMDEIELEAFTEELWDGISLLASRRFELGSVPRGTLRADPDRLAQALRNLLANAIDHTAAGGGLVRLRVLRSGERRVSFVVEDDGPGIAPDQRERVFDRFHRTDASRARTTGGTGLGLAIVRAIADAHGGSVRAGASPEGGASFVLELPGFTPSPRPVHPAAAEALSGRR
jgi:two-component system, OmpR family, sensor kinase